jgi:hypothetical protein
MPTLRLAACPNLRCKVDCLVPDNLLNSSIKSIRSYFCDIFPLSFYIYARCVCQRRHNFQSILLTNRYRFVSNWKIFQSISDQLLGTALYRCVIHEITWCFELVVQRWSTIYSRYMHFTVSNISTKGLLLAFMTKIQLLRGYQSLSRCCCL